MFSNVLFVLRNAQSALQTVAFYAVVTLTAILWGASALAALGELPWPQIALSFGGDPIPNGGMYLQLGLATLLLMISFFLPANRRMAQLEQSHRSFQIGMEDVKRAYEIAHSADRRGVFTLSSEFESMRQRMELLRKHPDLGHLEPELLALAAQMSHESRDLARAYSEDRVARAKGFLKGRQEEVDAMEDRIKLARMTCDELRNWVQDIEAVDRRNNEQIKRLEADLREILPGLGYDFEENRDANVVSLPKANSKSDLH